MNEDELLERFIRAQERGPNAQATQPGDGDLADLARLAATIKHLPHPSMQPQQTRLQRRVLLAEVSQASQVKVSHPPGAIPRQNSRPAKSPANQKLANRPGYSRHMLCLIGLLALLGASLWINGLRNSQAAILEASRAGGSSSRRLEQSPSGRRWRASAER
jgi:hypothetical protein